MNQISVGTFRATSRARRLIDEVLDSGRISYGPKSRQFEQEFAGLHDCAHGALSNSGTSSLLVAIQALAELDGWKPGDEIIVPALTFVATVNVVIHAGFTPVLVDVEPDTYGIDVSKIAGAITDRTRAIIAVHLFGQPCDMAGVLTIAQMHDLRIIEDSCETVGATLHGAPVGSWGDVGCFSLYVAHHLVAGVGGVSTTNNPELATIMRSLVNHGIDTTELPRGGEYDPTWLGRKFTFVRVGHSFRVTELEAALALAALEEWPTQLAKRQRRAHWLTALLQDCPWLQLPVIRPGATHSWMMYPIVMRYESKHGIRAHLERCNIETRDMVPLVSQPAYRGLWNPDDYPVARNIDERGFYIGCHQDLTVADLDDIAEAFNHYARRD
jgi:dTDP-4-amino-4,6-dideoxygalactose transaminase